MKQHVVSGILCLTMAGCAQSRPVLTKEDSKPNPVALAPVPSVYDTVNTGMGGKALAKTAIANPDDPHWSGQAQVAMVPKSSTGGPASAARGTKELAPASSAAPASPDTALSQAETARPSTVANVDAPAAASATAAALAGNSAADNGWPPPPQSPTGPTASSSNIAAAAAPAGALTAAGPSAGEPSGAADPPIAAVSNLPPVGDLPAAGPNLTEGAGQPPEVSASGERSGAMGVAAGPASSPSPIPLEASNGKPPSPKRDRDPLLGPDPDIMPPMNDLPPLEPSSSGKAQSSATLPPPPPNSTMPRTNNTSRPPVEEPDAKPASSAQELAASPDSKPDAAGTPPLGSPGLEPASPSPAPVASPTAKPSSASSQPGASPAAAPGGASLESAPPVEAAPSSATKPPAPDAGPAPAPAPAAAPALPDLPPLPGDPDKTTAISQPAAAGSLAAAIPLETAPVSSAPSFASADRLIAGPSLAPPRRDGQVVLTSGTAPHRDPATEKNPNLKAAGHPVARVGDEIITHHDLAIAFRQALARYPELRQASDLDSQEMLAKRQMREMLLRQTLADLIVRTMLAQEARRLIQKHDPKEYDRFLDMVDKVWRDDELPPMKRRYNVETDQHLREKLAEHGQSLEAMRLSFRQGAVADYFLHEKLKDKLAVELPELLRYYNEHMPLHDFDRPALITWREFIVEAGKFKSREAARQQAEQSLRLLQNGEDFARLATAESDGPSSSRSRGGLMQTSPGGYAIPAVSSALDTLEIGQLSGILEGPDSFHIVRVENRRPAGPASFEEVQDKIRPILARKKEQDERVAYLSKLRKKTVIWTLYDGTPNDPHPLLP